MRFEKIGDFPIMRPAEFLEDIRVDERAIFKADILPEMAEIRPHALSEQPFGYTVAEFGDGVDDLLEQPFVVGEDITGADETGVIAELPIQRAAGEADGVFGTVERFKPFP